MDISKHSSYRDFLWAVELNRFGLELVGLWPRTKTTKENFVSDLRIGIIFVTITFLSIIPHLCALVRIWGDMILMIENLQVTLTFVVISLKIIVMRWKRTALSLIVKMMAEDWIKLKIDAERDVMMRRARAARLIVICGYVLMMLAYPMVIILPAFGIHIRHVTNLTDRDRLLPLQAYYFYDTDKSPQFEFTLFVQAMTLALGAIIYTSVDTFLGVTIFHICGQLENFRHRMANLILCKDFDSALRNNVEIHLRLIRFVNNIEDTYTFMMLGLVFYFGIVFCLFGFLLVTVITSDEISNMSLQRVYFEVFGIVILLMHTFLYCGAGEIIAEQCDAVYRTICDLEWYRLESRKGRALILLMLRASEPFHITAGKIFPLTMTTFCSLLKTSAGYISFLLAKN